VGIMERGCVNSGSRTDLADLQGDRVYEPMRGPENARAGIRLRQRGRNRRPGVLESVAGVQLCDKQCKYTYASFPERAFALASLSRRRAVGRAWRLAWR
jgi:N-acyl-D-aspartate/D-glutamate deacylase